MALIKGGREAHDPWTVLADDTPPPDGPVLVSLERWRAQGAELSAGGRDVGVVLRSDQTPAEIAEALGAFDVIALEFPVFTDGRAYSTARLLRERYGYTGELRAIGNVLRDQLLFMQRVGFDAYEVPSSADVADWLAAFAEFDVVYQAGADARVPVPHLRHGAAVDGLYWTAG